VILGAVATNSGEAAWDHHHMAVTHGRVALVTGSSRGLGAVIARRPPPGRSAYATAKSAQVGLTLSWARELAPFGITVNTVAPGFIPVERHASVRSDARKAYLASVPAGRMGTPDDIAHAVSSSTAAAASAADHRLRCMEV
jgi:3-oxoacyl-[acyl-carrier protein] reductase